jgi:predicted Zn-dependent protease
VSVDAQVGEIALQQVKASHRLLEAGPALGAVRTLGERLVAAAGPPAAGFRFRFEVADDASLNAFAAPGGLVVVHTGLIAAARSPDEVAGVLAHEIAHVTERHSVRQLVLQAGVAASVQLLLGSPDGAAGALTAAATELATLRFSRDQEHAADVGGLDLLKRAELPPDGLVGFFDRLAREGGGPPAFLSTHPAPDDRVSRLQAEIARRGTWAARPLAIDWAGVHASLAKP